MIDLAAASSAISPLTIVSLVITVISVGIAVMAFLSSRGKDTAASLAKTVSDIVSEAIAPVNGRLGVLETKIDVFWRNVAFDAAKILHSPHDSRTDLDELIEAFEGSRLSILQESQLRLKLLELRDGLVGEIMDGQPTLAGDRIAAAIIIRVLDQEALSHDGR